jgi:hypothetical protein
LYGGIATILGLGAWLIFGGNKSNKPAEKPAVTPPPVIHPPAEEPPTIEHPDTPEEPPTIEHPDTPEEPPTIEHPPEEPPVEAHGTATGRVFDDPKYQFGNANYFEDHTTGNLTYVDDASDNVHSQITVEKSKVAEAGTGKQLTFVKELKFQNDGKTLKVTNTHVHVGGKSYDIKGEGSADLGHDGKVTWHNGTVTIETAEGKHVVKTKNFQMAANKKAYGPAYLEIDSTSNSKQLDVSGVVGDGMNAQLAGLGSPKKALRSFNDFVNNTQVALTKAEMEAILH